MKRVDFLETIVACDLQVGRSRQQIVSMKVFKVNVIFDNGPMSFTYEN